MADINTSLNEQPGGWFRFNIYEIDHVTSCPDLLTNANASSIVINPPTDHIDILPVRESIKIRETSKKTKAGVVYNIKGEFTCQIQTKELDTYLNKRIHKKVIFVGIKHFGQQKIYGSKKCPLALEYQLVNGIKYEDGSAIKVLVSGKIPQKPVFIND